MNITEDKFIVYALSIALVMSMIFMLPIGFIITLLVDANELALILLTYLLITILSLLFTFHIPHFNKQKIAEKIEGEVAVAGRRLLIQIESGKSLQNSIIDITKNKKEKSMAFEILAYELFMGKNIEFVISDAIKNIPSKSFKKIFIQIRNSLNTGTDLKRSLRAALREITREKSIEFETFGKKLGPLGMFYMFFGTVAPSIGVVIFAIILIVLGITVELKILSMFLFFTFLIQLFFISIFSKLRPNLEI